MLNRFRHLIIVAVAGVLALALGGCVTIAEQSSTQLDGVGPVQVTTRAELNSGAGSAQGLLAYRIPTASTAPAAINTIATTGGPGFRFDLSPSYTAELQTKSPPPSGQKWVGYVSEVVSFGAGTKDFTVAPLFSLVPGSDGSAFRGPFNFRTIVGWRIVDGTHPADRPVVCGSPITTEVDGTDCASDPEDTNIIASNLQQPTQDLGILDASGVESVKQGNVARVKFQADYAGDGNPAPTFLLDATTTIPDTTVSPSTPVLTPDEGTTLLRVIGRVPVSTPPGLYDVTLVASVGGEVRASTHEILVTPTTVRCTERAPTIAGTRQDDVLVGTPGPDVIAGYAGDDEVIGLAGNDLICTGRGDDTLRGGAGNDRLAGRRGNDRLTGGSGRNVIDPGPGRDRLIQ
jgi:hypothetical protein